jgi:hypothetical protein
MAVSAEVLDAAVDLAVVSENSAVDSTINSAVDLENSAVESLVDLDSRARDSRERRTCFLIENSTSWPSAHFPIRFEFCF